MIFIGTKNHYNKLKQKKNLNFYNVEELPAQWDEIHSALKKGECMIFVSLQNIEMLRKLWIFSYNGKMSEHAILKETPHKFNSTEFGESDAAYLYVRSTDSYAMHGIDEEPRAEIVPLVVDRDIYGRETGAPGIWLKNYAGALTSGNYKGSNWYIFAFAEPLAAMPITAWDDIIDKILEYPHNNCYISRLNPEYPIYRKGERIRIDYSIENTGNELQSASITIEEYDSSGNKISNISKKEIALNPNDTFIGYTVWYPANHKDGVFAVKATLNIHNRFVYGLERENNYTFSDCVSSSFMISSNTKKRPAISVNGSKIIIDGKSGFFMGTHYYPSSTFFELSYRPFHVEKAINTVKAMQNAGIKICRIWCDPLLDELSLRGMECLIEILADNGIIAWVTIFNSWVHYTEVNTAKRQAKFEVVNMKDECQIGLFIKNIKEQRLYVAEMAERWRNFTNIVWDLSNEFSVVDPEPDDIDEEWVDKSYKSMKPPYQNIDLFKQWADQLKEEIRKNGALQPIVYGASCWDTGSENYRCTKDADIIVNHTYHTKELSRIYANYQNSVCLDKPYIIEEFGGVWENNQERAKEFDSRFHGYIASGNNIAMSYEWGTSWLCDKMSGIPPYLKFRNTNPLKENGPFILGGRYDYAKSWPDGSIGVCPWIASHMYGINYPNTDYESPTILVTKRFAQIGQKVAFLRKKRGVYLVLPFETNDYHQLTGYTRKCDAINKCINLLWNNGIDFEIWQDDSFDSLPETARLVIYPCTEEIPKNILNKIEEIKNKGVKIFKEIDKDFLLEASEFKTEFQPTAKAQLQIRPTEEGTLYIIHSTESAGRLFKIENTEIEVESDGMFLKSGSNITLAEFKGHFSIFNKKIAYSTGKITLMSEISLDSTDKIQLLPFEPAEIVCYGFKHCTVINDSGNEVDNFKIIDGHLSITKDICSYTFVLLK